MTRDEENRRLAEFADVQVIVHDFGPNRSCCRRCSIGINVARSEICYPDFYTDESANAQLLEKMPMPYLWLQRVETQDQPMWHCIADYEHIKFERAERNNDRKTAVVGAALYLEGQNGNPR